MHWIFRGALVIAFALGLSAALDGGARAEDRGAFTVGYIWSGGAWFDDDGEFAYCHLDAGFPEGWTVGFYVKPDHMLGIEFDEPDIGRDTDPGLNLKVDGREIADADLRINLGEQKADDWLMVLGDIGRIENLAPALKSGDTLTAYLHGDGALTLSAALTYSDRAFSALEDCLARNGGAAPAQSASASSSASSSHDEPEPTYYGAIAIGEDDDGLLSAIATGYSSHDEAGDAAVKSCERNHDGNTCSAEMYLEDDWPCGAVTGGNDGDGQAIFAYARAESLEQAKIDALETCSDEAYGCRVELSGCVND